MFSIIEHIEYLIKKNDCVIIPSWGALIANYSHATFDAVNGRLIAPKRFISFNQSINVNDGLLADSISRKENITYEEALKAINNEVGVMKNQIFSGEEVTIGRIGFFSLNVDKNLCFDSFRKDSTQSEFYGLRSIELETLETLKRRELEAKIEKPENITSIRKSSRLNFAFRNAASIILLLVLTVILSTPTTIKNNSELASLNIISAPKEKIETGNLKSASELIISIPQEKSIIEEKAVEVESRSEINQELNKVYTAPVSKTEVVKVEKTREQIKEVSEAMPTNVEESDASYYLIVASLSSMEEAKDYVADKPNLQILEKDNKYRAYVASSSTYSEINSMKNTSSVRSNYPGAWILKK